MRIEIFGQDRPHPADGSPIVDVLAANRAEFSASRARTGASVHVSTESGYAEIRVRSTDGTDRAVVTPRDFPGEIYSGPLRW